MVTNKKSICKQFAHSPQYLSQEFLYQNTCYIDYLIEYLPINLSKARTLFLNNIQKMNQLHCTHKEKSSREEPTN